MTPVSAANAPQSSRLQNISCLALRCSAYQAAGIWNRKSPEEEQRPEQRIGFTGNAQISRQSPGCTNAVIGPIHVGQAVGYEGYRDKPRPTTAVVGSHV